MKRNIYTSVEFGSYSIKLLVSEFIDDKQNLLFIDEMKTDGIDAGIIHNKGIVTRDMRKLVDKAEGFLDAKIKSIVIMLPSVNLSSKEVSYDITIPENRVTGKHIKNLFNRVYTDITHQKKDDHSDQEIAFIYPRRFLSSKSRKSLLNPINEITRELIVSLEVIFEDKQTMIDYVEIIDELGIEILDIMPNVIAYKNSLLSSEELYNYACVVDIGHKSTTITVYKDNLVYQSESFKLGSSIITKAIAETLSLNLKDANEFKMVHGQTVSKLASDEIVFEQRHTDGSITYITSEYIAKLIDSKYAEIIRLIRQYLNEAGLKNKISKYILIGGATQMTHFEAYFKQSFGEEVSIRRPDFIGTRHPKYSSIISGHFNIYYLEKIFEEEYEMIVFNQNEETIENTEPESKN